MIISRGLVAEPLGCFRDGVQNLIFAGTANEVLLLVKLWTLVSPLINTPLLQRAQTATLAALRGYSLPEGTQHWMRPHVPNCLLLGEDHQPGMTTKDMVVTQDAINGGSTEYIEVCACIAHVSIDKTWL